MFSHLNPLYKKSMLDVDEIWNKIKAIVIYLNHLHKGQPFSGQVNEDQHRKHIVEVQWFRLGIQCLKKNLHPIHFYMLDQLQKLEGKMLRASTRSEYRRNEEVGHNNRKFLQYLI